MRIRGIDFTSAPKERKPITVAEAEWDGQRLRILEIVGLTSLRQYEQALTEPGPWRMGLDLPFGLPRRFVELMGWPTAWRELMAFLAGMELADYVMHIRDWQHAQPVGGKEPLRKTDQHCSALSPLKLFYQPVGRMLFQGATRLSASGVSVAPCALSNSSRVAVEVYPGLLARAAGVRSYKKDGEISSAVLAAHQQARAVVLSWAEPWVVLPSSIREAALEDATGDTLDAILAALATAADAAFPPEVDPLEGWIVGSGLT